MQGLVSIFDLNFSDLKGKNLIFSKMQKNQSLSFVFLSFLKLQLQFASPKNMGHEGHYVVMVLTQNRGGG